MSPADPTPRHVPGEAILEQLLKQYLSVSQETSIAAKAYRQSNTTHCSPYGRRVPGPKVLLGIRWLSNPRATRIDINRHVVPN